MEISFKQTLFSIDSKNKRCNDCGEKHVTYVSINNGITICNLCVQIHRQLGPKISELKKIDEDFDDYTMNFFIYGGNKNFHKFLKELGVNSGMQRTKLYKTKGADYYRKYLLAKVKGIENTSKKPDDPNEIIQIDNNEDMKDNDNNYKFKEDKHSINNINNFLNIDNNEGKKTNVDEIENNGDSHIQLNLGNTKIQTNEKSNLKKSLLRTSINKVKTFGGYIKKNSVKGIKAMKKAGHIIAVKSKPGMEKLKSTAKYMGEHIPHFHIGRFRSQDDIRANNNFEDVKGTENVDDIKEDNKEKDDYNNNKQIEF